MAQRFNKFAYQRSEKLSEPLDQMRSNIRNIETRIQPRPDRLEQLGEDIRAEKVNFPEIREADALIFRMIGAAQKLKQSKEPIEAIDAVGEYADRIDELVAGFRGGIREASEQAQMARRDLGADALVALEETRRDLRREIKPQLAQLTRIRKSWPRAGRPCSARRRRRVRDRDRRYGNAVANASRQARRDRGDQHKTAERALNAVEMRGKIEEEIGKWEGKSAAEAQSALKARAKYEAERDAELEATTGGYGARAAREERKLGRVSSADKAVDAAVDRILKSDRNRPREEIRNRAQETTNRILSSPDGRLYYDEGQTPDFKTPTAALPSYRGSLAKRALNVSNKFAAPWINNNIERVVGTICERSFRTCLSDASAT